MNSINHYNPQFRGLSLSKYNKEARIAASEFIANVTHQDAKDVIKLTKTAGQKKIGFFKQLADKYNKDNYYRTPAERESSSLVNQIFTNVTIRVLYITGLFTNSTVLWKLSEEFFRHQK